MNSRGSCCRRLALEVFAIWSGMVSAQEPTQPMLIGSKTPVDPPQAMIITAAPDADGVIGRLTRDCSGQDWFSADLEIVAPTELGEVEVEFSEGNEVFGRRDLTKHKGVFTVSSPAFKPGRVNITMRAQGLPPGTSVVLRSFAIPSGHVEPLSIWPPGGVAKYTPASSIVDPKLLTATHAVALLVIARPDGRVPCTGFLIGSQTLMTNAHCVNSQIQCEGTDAYFGFTDQEYPPKTGAVGCKALLAGTAPADPDLDYALLTLKAPVGLTAGFLKIAAASPAPNTDLIVPQHPGGRALMVAQAGCKSDINPKNGRGADTDFGHSCDTAGGSSGSPMLDAQLAVVGLHHWGRNPEEPAYTRNRAVRIERIVDDLKKRGISIADLGKPPT